MIDEVFGLYRPDRVLVYLCDDNQNLRLQSQRFSDASMLRGLERVSEQILNQAVEEQEALLTKNASGEKAGWELETKSEQDLHSAMAIPIVKTDRILGVIYMDTLAPLVPYTREDLHLMNALAAQAALAIENVLNYDRQLEQSRKLVALGEISRKVSSFLSRDVVIREAVEGTLQLFECTKCSLLLLDEDEEELVIAFSNHIDRKAWGSIRIKPGEGLCGKVFQGNEPMLVENAGAVPEAGRRVYDTDSFLIVPIVSRMEGLYAQSEVIGVIAVTDKSNRAAFDKDDQELLSVLSWQVGIAINNARLYERATIDVLTRVFTRAFFFSQLEEEILAHRIRKAALSVMMIDLDHFKQKNDELGHQVGDRILNQLGRMLRQRFLRLGFVARYGGEEFVVLLRSTDSDRARQIGEATRAAVEEFLFVDKENPVQCTISIGIARMEPDEEVDDIVRRADAALYHAKNCGRNRVELFGDDTPMPSTFRRTRRKSPRPPKEPGTPE
ncbi:MAG: diguanylate cyclase [Planctomycetota bacterium]|jgi:diguanylate cyclase (GGDEF)-like protein